MQPLHEDNFSQENTAEFNVQVSEEPTHLGQHVIGDTHASEVSTKPNAEKDLDQHVIRDTHASELSPKPNTEKDLDPGKAC